MHKYSEYFIARSNSDLENNVQLSKAIDSFVLIFDDLMAGYLKPILSCPGKKIPLRQKTGNETMAIYYNIQIKSESK